MDDLLVTWSYEEKIGEFKQRIMNMVEMIDLGLLSSYLGIQVKLIENEVV